MTYGRHTPAAALPVEVVPAAGGRQRHPRVDHIDEVPRIGHAGCRIAFIDPKATENCLIELAELPAGHA